MGGGDGEELVGRGRGKWVFAFDRDPKLKSEDQEAGGRGVRGEETNIICRQNKHYSKHTKIHTTLDYRDAYKHQTISQHETVKLRTCMYTCLGDLCDLCDL